jgi:HAD superfamily hydrolase (TIGR01509 family)
MLRALLWDVDGTLAETERDGHLVAFNEAFAAHGLPIRWSGERYGELLAVAGGRERLLHDLATQPCAPADPEEREALARSLHRAKNAAYARIVTGGQLALRPGVAPLLEDCARAGVALAIVTTTSAANVDALLRTHLGERWRARFAAIVCAEEAPVKKPDPQAYLRALALLGIGAADTLAIEDSPAGVAAARAAGVPVVLQRSYYFASGSGDGTLAAGATLAYGAGWQSPPPFEPASRIGLDVLAAWHGAGDPGIRAGRAHGTHSTSRSRT